MHRIILTAAALLFAVPMLARAADEWGKLTLRFVYDGPPPKPAALKIDRDKDVCKEGELFDESLLVSAKDKGIANVIVWVSRAAGEAAIPIHPDYEKNIQPGVTLAT